METNKSDVIVMRLLHYFMTEKNYNPVVIQGAKNEIWLENMKEDYKIIRIVSKYIHNDEQFDFDHYKATKIGKSIKKQTFSLSLNILSIYTDIGENAHVKDFKNMTSLFIEDENDLTCLKKVERIFPDIMEKLTLQTKDNKSDLSMFLKLTTDIEQKSVKDAAKANKVFTKKKPYITYILIAINVIIFMLSNILGIHGFILDMFCLHGPSVRNGEIYRVISSVFLHADIIHLLFNCYALYAIGTEVENYLGRIKFLIIYLLSGVFGSLLSITLGNHASVGASGAIFGLMGSLLYFGYHYRVYLGQTLKSQIFPLIILNLTYGFMVSGIDNFAHIGGLSGGVLTTASVGVNDKESKTEQINAIIISTILIVFLIYMAIFMPR